MTQVARQDGPVYEPPARCGPSILWKVPTSNVSSGSRTWPKVLLLHHRIYVLWYGYRFRLWATGFQKKKRCGSYSKAVDLTRCDSCQVSALRYD